MNYQRQLPIEELARKLKPIFGKKIDELYFRFQMAESIEEKNEILQVLTSLYQKNLNQLLDQNILLEPPKESEITGEYPLGVVNYAGKKLYSFGLNEKDWPRHVCISGMSGSGKTTFAFNLIENFIKKDKPFLVFDWKKSFRPLMNIDPNLMVFTVGNEEVSNLFKTNINVPPQGVSPKEWINTLCDLLTESFQVSFGVHKILLETLDEVFRGWGIYEGKKHYPNWLHVKKMLEIKAREAKSRESTWYESALRIATVLTFGSFGKVINYDGKKAVSIEDLENKRAVLELNSLSNIEKKFFSEFILTYMYKSKKANQKNISKTFDYAVVVDEAHNIFLKDKTHFVSESVTDMVYREMREYGVSLICLDQHVSKLSDTVKGNSAVHIAFQQQLPEDIKEISLLMQSWDKKEIFSKIPVGQAIVKLAERYSYPFLIDVGLNELRYNTIENSKIKSRMSAIVDGANIEKYEPEFKEALINPKESQKQEEKQEIHVTYTPKIQENQKTQNLNQEKNDLTNTQKVLYDFLIEQINKGRKLNSIERLFESKLHENCYTYSDIQIILDYFLKNKLKNEKREIQKQENKEISKTQEKPKEETVVVEVEDKFLDYEEDEQKIFISFLIKNPNHKFSTVETYKQMGFSARKGNKIKNELLKAGLIKIEEEKNEHGWKKYIRLKDPNSDSLNKTQLNRLRLSN